MSTSTESTDLTCDSSSARQPKRIKKVHVKRPPPKKKVKNQRKEVR